MTILSDLDVAIDNRANLLQPDGTRWAHNARLRMGPSARHALAAAAGPADMLILIKGEPVEYRGIPIEAVEAPYLSGAPDPNRFNGWILVA